MISQEDYDEIMERYNENDIPAAAIKKLIVLLELRTTELLWLNWINI